MKSLLLYYPSRRAAIIEARIKYRNNDSPGAGFPGNNFMFPSSVKIADITAEVKNQKSCRILFSVVYLYGN